MTCVISILYVITYHSKSLHLYVLEQCNLIALANVYSREPKVCSSANIELDLYNKLFIDSYRVMQ